MDPSSVKVSGPLAEHAVDFAEELNRRGYAPEGAARHMRLVAQLSAWLDGQGLTAGELTEERVAEFLEARRAGGWVGLPSQRWAMTLLGWVPALGVVPTPPPPPTPVEVMVEQYRRYLLHERGLASGTVRGYVGVARLFLSRSEKPDGLDLIGLTAVEVSAFVVAECRGRAIGSAKTLVTGLRSLLWFLFFEGHTTHQLTGAVPAASGMGGHLPRGLGADVVAGLLDSCDRATTVGRRDYAILTVLSRLGLRIGEVAGLSLDDVDWHHGEVVLRGKGARRDRLPLPVDVGEAVVAYLSSARPRVPSRVLFLRVRAPITALHPSSVAGVVGRACRRAGVPVVGAHRLRHSAATAMLRAGASLAEIGQVLRHSDAATTARYAKVDRGALRALAQTWPGTVA
ncbi:MAG: site-specific integrase [Actinobacteria bacterium]|nr:site-specific integrase [Actinomycetota bacterium]